MSKQLRHSHLFVLLLGLLAPSMTDAKMVGWWKLDDGAGTTAADSSGNKYNGTIVGTPQWVAGQLGGALKLSGSGNYVNCGVIPIATNGTGAISVCFWVNRAASGDHKFCSNRQGNNAAGGGFTCTVYQDRMEMDLSDATNRVLSRDATRPTIPGTNVWVHLAWVYDDNANTLKLYINGVLTVTATVTQSVGLSTQFFRLGSDSPNVGYYPNATIDDFRLADHAMTDAEIAGAMKGMGPGFGQAGSASPGDKATDVIRNVTLAWTAGQFAKTHDVYFGTTFTDVNEASRTSTKGVLVGQGQADTTYNAGRLEFGKTYFWRVDEVNAPPDSTIYKGAVWQFTVEPYSYPVRNVTATASSMSTPDMNPQKTVDGSGMAGDLHGTSGTDMWLSGKAGAEATWIQYTFDKAYKLHQMLVWNSNQLIESFLGFGAKSVTIDYSVDGTAWKTLGDFEFARAPGAAGYAANTTVDFAGVMVKYVKLTFKSNWGGVVAQYGLSEVRFFSVPVAAREPSPASGATNVVPEPTLKWRAGREAGSHQVFLGTDPNNLPQAGTVKTPGFDADLNLAQTYYWKVVEVNEAKDPAAWPSDVWSFTTVPFLAVDDFESYTDKAGQEVFSTWIDGFENPKVNGAIVGLNEARNGTFCETTIIQGGKQAMPLAYSNAGGPTYSETTRTFDTAQDWTRHGYKTLALSFYGDPNNTGQMYLKINNTKIPYNGKADDLKRAQWQPWNIDLATSGADLKSVKKITIGVDGAGASGILRFDNICLYPTAGAMITPVDPGQTGLVAWYKFDGDFKDSAGTFAGTARGDAKIINDPVRGQVVSLDGVGDAVAVPLLGSGNTLTIAMWVNTAVDPVPLQYESFFHANGWEAKDLHWRYTYGKVESGINGLTGNLTGVSIAKPNQWNHVAVTVSSTEWALWLNGLKETSRTLTAPAAVTLGEGLIGAWLGTDGTTVTRAFTGKIDDVRFYSRALSPEEIASLAGRTEPFAKPF